MKTNLLKLTCGLALLGAAATAQAQYTYTTLDDPLGVNGTIAIGISGNNVVGYYVDTSQNIDGFEASIEPAPEPTTLALAGLGGLSLLLFRRRK